MADSNVGSLPVADSLNDDSLLVMEQNGEAMCFKGKVIKDWVEPYSTAAVNANTAAQSALSGIKTAINNIPAGSTPIVNDLTTGGTTSALSAEMGKMLGAHASRHAADGDDPITPSMIGALPVIDARSADYDMDTIIQSGAHVAYYDTNANTLGTPYKYGVSAWSASLILSYAKVTGYAVQVAFSAGCTPLVRTRSGGITSPWRSFVTGDQFSNPNLLDNWYFCDPINQRGATEYTASGYTIDRWYSIGNTVTLTEDGVGLTNAATYVSAFRQLLPVDEFKGKTIIASILSDNTNATPSIAVGTGINSGLVQFGTRKVDGNMVYMCGTVPEDTDAPYLVVGISVPIGGTATIQAVKLELGSVQTLAHQDSDGNWVLNDPPPNKQQELAKCQRYFVRINPTNAYGLIAPALANTTTTAQSAVPLPVTLRSTPAVTFSGNLAYYQFHGGTLTALPITAMALVSVQANGIQIASTLSASATQNSTGFLRANNDATAYIDLSADL